MRKYFENIIKKLIFTFIIFAISILFLMVKPSKIYAKYCACNFSHCQLDNTSCTNPDYSYVFWGYNASAGNCHSDNNPPYWSADYCSTYGLDGDWPAWILCGNCPAGFGDHQSGKEWFDFCLSSCSGSAPPASSGAIWINLFVDLNGNGQLDTFEGPGGSLSSDQVYQQPWAKNFLWWNASAPSRWHAQQEWFVPTSDNNYHVASSIVSSTKYGSCNDLSFFPINKINNGTSTVWNPLINNYDTVNGTNAPITLNVYDPVLDGYADYPYPGNFSCPNGCDCGPVWAVPIWPTTVGKPYVITPKEGENWKILSMIGNCSGNGYLSRCDVTDGKLYVEQLSVNASTSINLFISTNPLPTPIPTPTPTPTPTPQPAVGWWQVKDADVSTNGNLTSLIPDTCTLPICNPVFGLKGAGGYPGVPAYGGTADFSLSPGAGTAGETYNWSANSQTSFHKIYDYSYFKSQIPSDLTLTAIDSAMDPSCVSGGNCTVNGSAFETGGTTDTKGYTWYHFDGTTLGDLTINGNISLAGTRKVILMVEGGDLNLKGKINIGTPGSGFFMAVVGKDADGGKGNINVDAGVTGTPSMEGIFLADGKFQTGTGGASLDSPLKIRGAVAAYGGVVLQRDLGTTLNSTAPAETFEYAPDLIVIFPHVFAQRRMNWQEVAP